jgi:hypothetical protein
VEHVALGAAGAPVPMLKPVTVQLQTAANLAFMLFWIGVKSAEVHAPGMQYVYLTVCEVMVTAL